MNDHIIVQYLTQSHSLSPEPVAVSNPVNIAIDRPGVKEGVHEGKLGEDAQAGAKDAAERGTR